LFLGTLALIGFGFNVWLYLDDRKNRGSILHNVPTTTMDEMVTSPVAIRRTDLTTVVEVEEDDLGVPESVDVVEFTAEERAAIKRSMARSRNSFAK
jgi:hypothetical protein